jgi:hypothetical protein
VGLDSLPCSRVPQHDATSWAGASHSHLHPQWLLLFTRNRIAVANVK